MDKKSIFLVRHGESFNNIILDRSLRVPDPLLTPVGRKQIYDLSENVSFLMKKHNIKLGLVSPFKRTIESALILRENTGLELQLYKDLHEIGGFFDVQIFNNEEFVFSSNSPSYLDLKIFSNSLIKIDFNEYTEYEMWWSKDCIDRINLRIARILDFFSTFHLNDFFAITHGDLIQKLYFGKEVIVSNSSIHKLDIEIILTENVKEISFKIEKIC